MADRGDRPHELLDPGVLQQVATRARAHRGHDRVVVEHGEDEHGDVGVVLDDLSGGRDPVQAGHLQVHEHDVGAQRARELDRLGTGGRLADDQHLGRSASIDLMPSR